MFQGGQGVGWGVGGWCGVGGGGLFVAQGVGEKSKQQVLTHPLLPSCLLASWLDILKFLLFLRSPRPHPPRPPPSLQL